MKTLGLIGGCSAESTSFYYARINRMVRERLPGHGAKLLLWSFDFEEIDDYCRDGDWDQALKRFTQAAHWLQAGGADAIMMCTNTMHRIADPLAAQLSVPLLDIIDITANAITVIGHRRPILLGTRFTMQEAFYRERLEKWDMKAVIPSMSEREAIHEIIYDELIQGRVNASDRRMLQRIILNLIDAGGDSLILGCTELGLILGQDDVTIPLFDTAKLHVDAAVGFALAYTH